MPKDITAERIRERRMELGLTQAELAEMSGYSGKSSINKIEKESRGMPIDKLIVIAKSLKCSPEYLMGWDDEEGKKLFSEDVDRELAKLPRNEREEAIISLFRLLSDEQKQLVTNLIESLAVKK